MSLKSGSLDEEGSEANDKFDEVGVVPPTSSPRLLGLLRQLSDSKLSIDLSQHSPISHSPTRKSPDCSPRTGPAAHSRQLSACSSRKSLQDEQSRRLSTVTRQRTDDLLSEIVEDELKVKQKFAKKRASCRDQARPIEQVLYDDAATIRSHLEKLRIQTRNAADLQATIAGTTNDSKQLLLRKIKRILLEKFEQSQSNRNGTINRDCLRMLLEQLGIMQQQQRSESQSKADRLFSRLWSILEKDQGSGPDGITFKTFYRYTVVIMFPMILSLLNDPEGLGNFEKQILDETAMIPTAKKNGGSNSRCRGNAFAESLDATFLSGLARSLIENANLIRLVQPVRKQQHESSEDEFDFHPEITPRSARLAGRQRQYSGGRRFTEELQQYARETQRRRDANEAKRFETELDGCTFRPAVNGRSARHHRSYDSRSRFEQLYEIGVHRVEERRREQRCRSESPVAYRPFQMRSIPAAVIEDRPLPRGFQETVERSRRAFRQRLRKQIEHDQLGQQFVERYDRRDKRATLKAPAKGEGDDVGGADVHDRYAEWYKQRLWRRRNPAPLLHVDVNIGHGRKGRIAIYSDSDAGMLSRDFAKVFGLDRDTRDRLTGLLEQHCRRVQGSRSDIGPPEKQVEIGEHR